MYSVYLITNLANGKVYVGQTIKPVHARWLQHISSAVTNHRSNRMYLCKAIRKHGRDNFQVETIATAETRAAIDNLEALWIIALRANLGEHGYNLIGGGRKGYEMADETREKIRAANLGKKVSAAAREKMRAAKLGTKLSAEHRAKISKSVAGITRSPETRQKMSIARLGKGDISHNLGSRRTPETRAKIVAAWKIRKQNENKITQA